MSQVGVTGTSIGKALQWLLNADVEPGDDISYELAKALYLYHPLGGKMVDSPIAMAMSEPREITVQDAPDEVIQAFQKQWAELSVDDHIANVMRISRIYGIASIVIGCEGVNSQDALDMEKIWDMPIFFNELDPLNTAGSLVLNQVATAPDFNKPRVVASNGQTYHRSRFQVVMNESPVFLAYSSSAFGFVGRSVYQRALYPLKSFIRTMIADDAIATKNAVLVAKQSQAGSIGDALMEGIARLKRIFLKNTKSGEVISIGPQDDISAINMQNVDGAGTFSRNNIIRNIETSADMPAKFLANETLVDGFGEGVEDAKNIIRYINGIRKKMQAVYGWFDNIIRYRAWNPQFFKLIQSKYPERYGAKSYEEAFYEWRSSFSAIWPSLMMEPESERIKVAQCKFEMLIATVQSLITQVDPFNKMVLVQFLAQNLADNKMIFEHELAFDFDSLKTFFDKSQIQVDEAQAAGNKPEESEGGVEDVGGVARKFGKFDSADDVEESLNKLNTLVTELSAMREKRLGRLKSRKTLS